MRSDPRATPPTDLRLVHAQCLDCGFEASAMTAPALIAHVRDHATYHAQKGAA